MKSYTQLTQEQRYQIYALKKAELNQTEIAVIIGMNTGTISRELKRNSGFRGYRPQQAHALALCRRANKATLRIGDHTWRRVKRLLREEWSPEQISGWILEETRETISPEWIYRYVLEDKAQGGDLYRHLRCQRQRKKRYGTYSMRGQLTNRTSIDERPSVVDSRSRYGDWELDTIIGKGHKQAIVSLTERKSKLSLIAKVPRKTADLVAKAIIGLLSPITDRVHTLTSDNGKEFAQHETMAKALDADFYFAHPYSSWERGLNENTNGLIRQYFPKDCDFTTITAQQIKRAMNKLNNRPRKSLGFKTPNQVFFGINPPVALVS